MPSYAPGFGAGPHGLSPFGVPADDWAEEGSTVLRSSRKIDLVAGTVELDDDGNPEGMDDTGQRVVLAMRRVKVPALQGLTFDETMQQEVRRVLADASLTTTSPPDIDLYRKDGGRPVVVQTRPGGAYVTVHYRNNLTGTETSVTVQA
jgi:hypothetical protein